MRIAEAALSTGDSPVVEIGPGKGALTEQLLSRAPHVYAIEVDTVLVHYLQQRFRDAANLTILNGDVMKTDLAQWGSVTVAGNLPYYITSPIIDKVLALGALLVRAAFLVQEEVAERLAAKPGSREYGYLSVATQSRCRVEKLFAVKAGAFRPPPKVDSAVVRLTPQGSPPEGFLEFASRCFAHKRKTLQNNVPAAAGQPEARLRAEQLPVDQLLDLWRRLKA